MKTILVPMENSEAMQPALVVIDGVRVALAGMSAAPNANPSSCCVREP